MPFNVKFSRIHLQRSDILRTPATRATGFNSPSGSYIKHFNSKEETNAHLLHIIADVLVVEKAMTARSRGLRRRSKVGLHGQ